jgi:hypothetical protein
MNMETQCTPSRSSILTGRYSIRSGTYAVPFGGVEEGLTQWEITVAGSLSDAGYGTALYGKVGGITFRELNLGEDELRTAHSIPAVDATPANPSALAPTPERLPTPKGITSPQPRRRLSSRIGSMCSRLSTRGVLDLKGA